MWVTGIFAIITSSIIFILSPVRSIVILAGILIAGMITLVVLFYAYLIIPASILFFGIVVPATISGPHVYAVEYWQSRALRKNFKSYVNTRVMNGIITNPDNINFDGSLMNISIMFADIRNFTTISERLKPSEVVSGPNKYLSEIADGIISVDGYLDRYIGDRILALFGAPYKLPENGDMAAVKSGLDMLRRPNALNKSEIFP